MNFELVTGDAVALGSPLRVDAPSHAPVTVGAVQCAWDPDPSRMRATIAQGVGLAAENGAQVVFLQELTLSPYFAIDEEIARRAAQFMEPLVDGPTVQLAAELSREFGIWVHASLYEEGDCADEIGFNTAILVNPAGELVARTRKLHIPAFPGYEEHRCFQPGDTGFPVVEAAGIRLALPTCWDQWFPELARAYSLRGAQLIAYPTAIGTEVAHPEFDSRPMWEQMIAANGLANATFMVAINRIGTERGQTFYGSSFVSDPYGRVLARAPRDRPAVLVVRLDLDQRRDWMRFGMLPTRRPELYGVLTEPVRAELLTEAG